MKGEGGLARYYLFNFGLKNTTFLKSHPYLFNWEGGGGIQNPGFRNYVITESSLITSRFRRLLNQIGGREEGDARPSAHEYNELTKFSTRLPQSEDRVINFAIFWKFLTDFSAKKSIRPSKPSSMGHKKLEFVKSVLNLSEHKYKLVPYRFLAP